MTSLDLDSFLRNGISAAARATASSSLGRLLSSEEGGFGVHIEYEDLYASVVFFTAIYVSGQIAARLLKMPSLVGEIVSGILLGPPLADYVPNPVAFVMLGEIGLILLVLEAGIDIDLTTLKLIGTRGVLIAIVGSILPIGIGLGLALAVGTDTKGAIAAGAAFGPTSLGIAMNILRQGKIVNTPVGQLIVSAAVIDDMIALVVLSQLRALAGEITVSGVLIPIVSALLFLVLGGYAAVYVLPGWINRLILNRIKKERHGRVELGLMFALLLGLMPATYYSKASFLMGAFVAGLTFCRSHELHATFVSQFKRVMQWLMRIFFAASIGFQVPIKDFGNGTVLWQGAMFTLALLGKIATGFMVPNFNQTKRFTGLHFRDVLITGFSMAAEGEFAFVIAVFAVDQELISKDLYASIVLAVLISTIIPPFMLRYTITKYNRKAEEAVRKATEVEFGRKMDLESGAEFVELTPEEKEKQWVEGIRNNTTVFLCIQTQSASSWGLLPKIMSCMNRMKLEIIDHRSWHPRGVDTTLVNEIYAQDVIAAERGHVDEMLEARMVEVQEALAAVINQPDVAKVKVQRWYPGVVEEIVEEVEEKVKTKPTKRRLTIQERLLSEASQALEKDKHQQTSITREKPVEEILNECTLPEPTMGGTVEMASLTGAGTDDLLNKPRRRRQKMKSSPIVGGGLFSGSNESILAAPSRPGMGKPSERAKASFRDRGSDQAAELIIDGEVFQILLTKETLDRVRKGYSGSLLDSHEISIDAGRVPVERRLQGFIRNDQRLAQIAEETSEDEGSEISSSVNQPL